MLSNARRMLEFKRSWEPLARIPKLAVEFMVSELLKLKGGSGAVTKEELAGVVALGASR